MDLPAGHVTVSMLPVTFGLLSSHMHTRNDHFRTCILEAYALTRLKGVPIGGKIDWNSLDEKTKEKLEPVLTSRYAAHWGLMGIDPDPNLVSDLKDFVQKSNNQKRRHTKGFIRNLSQSLDAFKKKTADKPYWKGRKLEDILKDHRLTCFSTNTPARHLAQLTQLLLELAWSGRPEDFSKFHHINLANAYLFCEVRLEHQLLSEMQQLYTEMPDYIPWAPLYELCHGAEKGADLAINLTKWGWLLGWHGSESQAYRYPTKHSKKIGCQLFPSYPFHLDQICRLNPDLERTAPTFRSKTRYGVVDGQPAIGELDGYYVTDRSLFQPGKMIDESEKQEVLPTCEFAYRPQSTPRHGFRVWFLELKSLYDATMHSSVFTRHIHAKRAFHLIVKTNPVTKPPQDGDPYKDKRWPLEFEKYFATNFDLDAMRALAKTDELLINDLHGVIPEEEFEAHVDLAFDALLNPEVKTDPNNCFTIQHGEKTRTVCNEGAEQKAIDKIINHLIQVVLQKINIDFFGGRVSTYLKGCSPVLRTMERFRSSIDGREIDVANLDVKSCFDSVNLLHPNFKSRMEAGLTLISTLVSPKASDLVRRVMIDHLHEGMRSGRISFTAEPGTRMPKAGTLPTGFVLAPSLWTCLALPAAYSLSRDVLNGNLLDWDLCGDDLMVIAEHGKPEQTLHQTLTPWFYLAENLGLKFHFFKAYKEGPKKSAVSAKFVDYFKFATNDQRPQSAWAVKFPKRSIPLLHGGCALARGKLIETVTSLRKDSSDVNDRLVQELFKTKQHQTSAFVPSRLLDSRGHQDCSSVRLGENPSPMVRGRTPGGQPDTMLRSMLYRPRSPFGRSYFRSDNQREIEEDPSIAALTAALPRRKFFIFDREAQDDAYKSLVRNADPVTPSVPPAQLEEMRGQVEARMKGLANSYDHALRALARNEGTPTIQEKAKKSARDALHMYAYLVRLTQGGEGISPQEIQHYFIDAEDELHMYGKYPAYSLVGKRLKMSMTQEILYQEKISDSSDGRYAETVRKLVEGTTPLKNAFSNPYLKRAAGDIPYAIMMAHRGISKRSSVIREAIKRGIPTVPSLRVFKTSDGYAISKGELEVFDNDSYQTPLRNALHGFRHLNRSYLMGELSPEDISSLSDEERIMLTDVKKTILRRMKDRQLTTAINKIGRGPHEEAARAAGRRVGSQILI